MCPNSKEANRELVRRMIDEVWNERADGLDRFWHDATRPQAEHLHEMLTTGFPDLRIDIEDLIADGDRVAARLTFRGTHDGVFRDIPPTGRLVVFTSIRIYELHHGRVAQTWATVDALAVITQLQGGPPPDDPWNP